MDKMKIPGWDKSRELFLSGGLGTEQDTLSLSTVDLLLPAYYRIYFWY